MKKYIIKKDRSQAVVELISDKVSNQMQKRIKECGDFLAFIADKSIENKKLAKGNFCSHRFCPMCSWRQTKKDALKIDVHMKYIKTEYEKSFIFLTLTTPNIKADKLKNEIDIFNLAFKRLLKRKEVEGVVKGFVRKLEVTYNSERDDYNPHFHILIAVNKSYFTDKSYIKQATWLKLWQEVTGKPEITQVFIQKVIENEKKEVYEIATYSAKPSDYLHSKEVFDIFYNVLSGRQLLVYGGLFAKANKLFKDKKLDKYKLLDENIYYWFLRYSWGAGNYTEVEKRELNPDELEKYNNKYVDQFNRDFEEE